MRMEGESWHTTEKVSMPMPIYPEVRMIVIRGMGLTVINTLANDDNQEVIII